MNAGKRIQSLDGLRGLAALSVFFTHAGDAFPGSLPWPIDVVSGYGGLGVDVLFALSGFLITGILLDARGRPGFFSTFYRRRAARIFPLYYGTIAFAIAFMSLGGVVWYMLYAQNFLFAINIERTGKWGSPIGHFWTLAIEEQFYLAWPLVVFLCSRRALAWACIACAVMCPVFRFVALF